MRTSQIVIKPELPIDLSGSLGTDSLANIMRGVAELQPQPFTFDSFFKCLAVSNLETVLALATRAVSEFNQNWEATASCRLESGVALHTLELYDSLKGFHIALTSFAQTRAIFGAAITENDTNRIDATINGLSEAMRPFVDWWTSLSDKNAEAILKNNDLFQYLPFLDRERRIRYLSQQIAAQALDSSDRKFRAIREYRELLNVACEFNGSVKSLREVHSFWFHPDISVRRTAHESVLKALSEKSGINNSLREVVEAAWAADVKSRSVRDPADYRFRQVNYPVYLSDVLMDGLDDLAEAFAPYFEEKKRLLGVDSMTRADILAPVPSSLKSISYQEAVGLAIAAHFTFSPIIARHMRNLIEDGQLVTLGIRSGASAIPFGPKVGTYAAVPYSGTTDSVSDLCHELCHCVTAKVASDRAAISWTGASLFSEVDSLFGESLLHTHRLSLAEQAGDLHLQRALIVHRLDRLYRGTVRSLMIAKFEQEIFKQFPDNLEDHWLEYNRRYIPHEVEIDPLFRKELYLIAPSLFAPGSVLSYPIAMALTSIMHKSALEGSYSESDHLDLLGLGGDLDGRAITSLLTNKLNFTVRRNTVVPLLTHEVITPLISKLRAINSALLY